MAEGRSSEDMNPEDENPDEESLREGSEQQENSKPNASGDGETLDAAGAGNGDGTERDSTAETIFGPSSNTEKSASKHGFPRSGNFDAPFHHGKDIARLSEGRYHIRQKLGSGAMGIVNLAEDSLIQRPVAVKTLKSERSAKRVKGFLRETRVQGKLQHPNIVTVYDAGIDDAGEFAIVMQYIQGRNLAVVIESLRAGDRRDRQRFSLEAKLDVFTAVINALSYAHSHQLIHCDVKPANVIVGDHGEVWLADWGIARMPSGMQTGMQSTEEQIAGLHDKPRTTVPLEYEEVVREGAIFGTPRYMSPEQARGNVSEVDAKSDIYSAFILLYEMLTLSDWVSSNLTLKDTLQAAMNRPSPSLHDAAFDQVNEESIPTELRYFLQKGLARKREERFRDCGEVLQELLRIRNGNFAIRCPITLVKRLQNFLGHAIDRHPRIVIFLLIFMLVIWVGGIVFGALYLFG